MLESIKEIKQSLALLERLYLSLSNDEWQNKEGFLLLLNAAIDGISDEIYLIDCMIHSTLEND